MLESGMRLLASTNSLSADTAIITALSTIQRRFPKSLLSAYVTGSYANSYEVPTSDIDLLLVFEGNLNKNDEKLAEEIKSELENISPPLDIAFKGLSDLLETGEVGMKDHVLHIFGEPSHLQIPLPDIEDYIYRRMHSGYLRMQLTRKLKPYTYPMKFPDESSTFKGYDWREKITMNGKSFDSIKEIVVLTGWMATGLIAWKGRTHVPTKKHVVNLFKSVIGGHNADDLELITNLCRTQWSYMVPESEEGQRDLQVLLPKVLSIENFFLEKYQDFLIENLKNENPVRVRTSIIRLGEILYPNDRSLKALQNFKETDPIYVEALEKSISHLRAAAI